MNGNRDAGGSRNGRGEKRGRDRSPSAGPSQRSEKLPRQEHVRNKKRQEFFDQPVTIPEGLVKDQENKNNKPLKVVANYFELKPRKAISVTAYRVDFEPPTDITGLKRNLIRQHSAAFGFFLFDGGNELFLQRPMPDAVTVMNAKSKEGQDYVVTYKRTRDILYTEAEYLRIFNLVLRESMRPLDLTFLKRMHYDPQAIIKLTTEKLDIMPGYVTSVRNHDGGLLLNCDTVHKIYRSQNVLEMLAEESRRKGDWKGAFEKRLIGSVVHTAYNKYASYKIDDIDWDQNPASEFTTNTGPETFAAYYKRKYNILIRDLRQPLLVSKAKARNVRAGAPEYILLVPELCLQTGLTDRERTNFQLMRNLGDRTRANPQQRVERLQNFSRRLQECPESVAVLQRNSLGLERQLVKFDAFQLPTEVLKFGNDKLQPVDGDWKTLVKNNTMFKSVAQEQLQNWCFVFPQRLERQANEFLKSFLEVAPALNPDGRGNRNRIADPRRVLLINDRTETFATEIQKILRTQDPSFLLFLIPNNRADCYKAIKKETATKGQITPSQVVTERIANHKNLRSIATNIAIQMEVKLGGIPYIVNIGTDGIMYIGFDSSRDPADRNKNYVAMVASLNPKNEGGQFYTNVQLQEQGSRQLGLMVLGAINKFADCNHGKLPERILIYRDGVGEGDIIDVLQNEVEDIKAKALQLYQSRNVSGLKLGFIVINKRTNTRIMEIAGGGNTRVISRSEGYVNPPPGTVVNKVITLPERYDFYLISQKVSQGTVSPTYYNVLLDEFYPNRPDIMQSLTWKLCHLYYNWTGTTKVPSVIQYAKKLAMYVQIIGKLPSTSVDIKHQLYFL